MVVMMGTTAQTRITIATPTPSMSSTRGQTRMRRMPMPVTVTIFPQRAQNPSSSHFTSPRIFTRILYCLYIHVVRESRVCSSLSRLSLRFVTFMLCVFVVLCICVFRRVLVFVIRLNKGLYICKRGKQNARYHARPPPLPPRLPQPRWCWFRSLIRARVPSRDFRRRRWPCPQPVRPYRAARIRCAPACMRCPCAYLAVRCRCCSRCS